VFANILGGGSLAYNNISSEIFVGNYFNSIVNNINLSGGVSTFKNIGGTGNANSILFDNSGNFYFSTQGYGGAIPSISKVNSGGETSLFWDAGSNDGSYLCQIVYDQNQNEFYCQILNRDVWSDDTVKEIVKENFVFIQVSGFFIERLYFCRFFWFNQCIINGKKIGGTRAYVNKGFVSFKAIFCFNC
jgi:hypothetical protein